MKTLVLCIDALDEGYLKAFLHRTPTFRDLMRRGAFGPCRAQIPSTPPAWMEFAIGLPPTKFGVFGRRIGVGTGRIYEPRDVDGYWNCFSALAGHGVSVGLWRLPVWTSPPEQIGPILAKAGGWVVSGDFTHDVGRYPESMPIPASMPKVSSWSLRATEKGKLPEDIGEQELAIASAIKLYAKAMSLDCEQFYRLASTDVLIAYWSGVDRATHFLTQVPDRMAEAYEAADAFCKHLIEMDAWDDVVILSDHGGRPADATLDSDDVDGWSMRFRWRADFLVVTTGCHSSDGVALWRGGPNRRCRMNLRTWGPLIARLYGADVPPDRPMARMSPMEDWERWKEMHEAYLARRDVLIDDDARVTQRLQELGYVD